MLQYQSNELSSAAAFTIVLADSCFIQTQRLCEWCGHAPSLEEEMAISNIALDTLSHARYLYQEMLQQSRLPETPDTLVYSRSARNFRNFVCVELPQPSFADLVIRNLIFSSFLLDVFKYSPIADGSFSSFSAKASLEIQYHFEHADSWVRRLAGGTVVSRQRIQSALNVIWPHTRELCLFFEHFRLLVCLQPVTQPSWHHRVTAALHALGLTVPLLPDMYRCGYNGHHTEHLGHLIAVTQSVYREFPGGTW